MHYEGRTRHPDLLKTHMPVTDLNWILVADQLLPSHVRKGANLSRQLFSKHWVMRDKKSVTPDIGEMRERCVCDGYTVIGADFVQRCSPRGVSRESLPSSPTQS